MGVRKGHTAQRHVKEFEKVVWRREEHKFTSEGPEVVRFPSCFSKLTNSEKRCQGPRGTQHIFKQAGGNIHVGCVEVGRVLSV